MQSILMNISETLNIEYFFANLFKKAIAFSYQPLSCTRGLVLTPQEDPTRTNQEIIVELTKSIHLSPPVDFLTLLVESYI